MATASIVVVHEAIENMALKKIKPDMSVLTIVIIGGKFICCLARGIMAETEGYSDIKLKQLYKNWLDLF